MAGYIGETEERGQVIGKRRLRKAKMVLNPRPGEGTNTQQSCCLIALW
jgi:hypothetical protein